MKPTDKTARPNQLDNHSAAIIAAAELAAESETALDALIARLAGEGMECSQWEAAAYLALGYHLRAIFAEADAKHSRAAAKRFAATGRLLCPELSSRAA